MEEGGLETEKIVFFLVRYLSFYIYNYSKMMPTIISISQELINVGWNNSGGIQFIKSTRGREDYSVLESI